MLIPSNYYRRIVHLHHEKQWHIGWLEVKFLPDLSVVQVTLDNKLIPVIMPVIKRIKKAFDLTCHPDEIISALGSLTDVNPGLRVPGAFDGFEIAVQAILNQHGPTKTAYETLEKFVVWFGESYSTPFPEVTHAFPNPKRIAAATVKELSILGITRVQTKEIIALAQAIVNKKLVLTPDADVESTLNQLRTLLNRDECLAQYVVMRALSWPDAFPFSNKDLMKTLKINSSLMAQKSLVSWQPWRSYAAMHLWPNL
ncbi:MAG: hypothetical protein K2Y18_08280 [Alphaproteobacteria bacterium]|nr:hypothetical protein [Alphaproteobacteria bacterium]